jgi:glycosyltransferase involved in cell wall biosynthesis
MARSSTQQSAIALDWQVQDRNPTTGQTKVHHGNRFSDYILHDSVTVSVVIPALNEAENLPHVLPYIPRWVHEVLLVDGHSTDETIQVARELLPSVRVVYQEGRGKGAALRSGFAAASGDIVVMLDADGSTDPGEIPFFVGALLAGADFAKGSRFLQGGDTMDMPIYRKIGNGVFVLLANLLFRTRFTDITYGYNAVWRCYGDALALEIDDWSNEIISNIRVARTGLRVVEIACIEHKRIAGEAKLQTLSAGWQILKAIVRERTMPYQRYPTRRTIGVVPQLAQPVEGSLLSQSQLEIPNGEFLERVIGEAQ